MNYVIHKHRLNKMRDTRIEVPAGARILSVQEQEGQIVLYTMQDAEESRREDLMVSVVMTGESFVLPTDKTEFLDTVMLRGAGLVFHVFVERGEWRE